jgi:hypothetical protein
MNSDKSYFYYKPYGKQLVCRIMACYWLRKVAKPLNGVK